jgi:dipeptidyl aminopeptidase/acylaminoacyl peptidase
MQDDVTDGVRALIASGRVDPARVCIVGASYGGFAALFGAMQNPDLYRCSVSIAGDADLVESMAWERSEYGGDSPTYRYWLKSMGDPSKDRERMIAKSPARHAEAFAGPVLLIHGAWDGTVSVEQSRLMKKALERAGKKVRYVELPHAGHGGWSDKDHTTILTELETFLADNLGGARTSAPAEAASGSQ